MDVYSGGKKVKAEMSRRREDYWEVGRRVQKSRRNEAVWKNSTLIHPYKKIK